MSERIQPHARLAVSVVLVLAACACGGGGGGGGGHHGGWTATVQIDDSTGVGTNVPYAAAIADDGSALVTSESTALPQLHFVANDYRPSAGWSTTTTDLGVVSNYLVTSGGGQGHAYVLADTTGFLMGYALDGNGLSQPNLLSSSGPVGYGVGGAADGTALAVWGDGTFHYANYSPTAGWSLAKTNPVDPVARGVDLTADGQGHYLALFDPTSALYTTTAAFYDASSDTWTPTMTLTSASSGSAGAISANGTAIVAWSDANGAVYARHYDSSAGWASAEQIIPASGGFVGAPLLAMDDAGNALLSCASQIRRFTAGTWSADPTFTNMGGGDALAVAGEGTMFLMFHDLDANKDIYVWDGASWSPPFQATTATDTALLAASQTGRAIVVWFGPPPDGGSGTDVYARFYSL